jgi:hypothetical protein
MGWSWRLYKQTPKSTPAVTLMFQLPKVLLSASNWKFPVALAPSLNVTSLKFHVTVEAKLIGATASVNVSKRRFLVL